MSAVPEASSWTSTLAPAGPPTAVTPAGKLNGFEKRLRDLQAHGVMLSQCANTLRELHVDRGNLYDFIRIVPSGMGEITIRESQGWAYIHPSAPESQL